MWLPPARSAAGRHDQRPAGALTATALLALVLAACSSTPPAAAPTVTITADSPAPFTGVHNDDQRTVDVTIDLNDSFDMYPDGHCAGRDLFAGISSGVQVQLKGASVGGISTAAASTQVHQLGNFYCAVKATFTPTTLDPNGYLIKFGDRAWENGVTPDNDEWGTFHSNYQACQHRIAQPQEKCP